MEIEIWNLMVGLRMDDDYYGHYQHSCLHCCFHYYLLRPQTKRPTTYLDSGLLLHCQHTWLNSIESTWNALLQYTSLLQLFLLLHVTLDVLSALPEDQFHTAELDQGNKVRMVNERCSKRFWQAVGLGYVEITGITTNDRWSISKKNWFCWDNGTNWWVNWWLEESDWEG